MTDDARDDYPGRLLTASRMEERHAETSPSVAIVICAYNEEKYIGACLECVSAEVKANQERGNFSILVIDNSSDDQTAMVAAQFPLVRVVVEPRKGLTYARQAALESSSAELMAYVDADTMMPAGWMERALKHFGGNSNIACVSGPIVYFDLPPLKQVLVKQIWIAIALCSYRITGYVINGGNFLATREALVRTGGFDTSIKFYGEDTDIARRLARVGKVRFDRTLLMPTSARRVLREGLCTTFVRYALNYVSEVVRKRPAMTKYRDIR